MMDRLVGALRSPSPAPGTPQTADKAVAGALTSFAVCLLALAGLAAWPTEAEILSMSAAFGVAGASAVGSGIAAYAKRNREKRAKPVEVRLRMPGWSGLAAGALALMMLGGCAGLGPTGQQSLETEAIGAGAQGSVSPFVYSPPNYSGITAARILIPRPDGQHIVAEFVDGKESGEIAVVWTLPDGESVSYTASDVRAFEGQAFRAEVEQRIVDVTGQTLQQLTPEVRGLLETAITAACTAAGGTC